MKVTLISHTQNALTLLLRTKNTRLGNAEDDPENWPESKQLEHLAYMRDTIKSSWEFVDFVFRIEGVTRAFTHQLVRSRHGSYAQEAQRVVDVRDAEITVPDFVQQNVELLSWWEEATQALMTSYEHMLDEGTPAQDARGLLPTNIQTSIIAKLNLRSLHEMALLRLCTRTQGEYQSVFRAMREEVAKVYPWAKQFLNVFCVEHAHCAFPRYGAEECPVYSAVIPQPVLVAKRIEIEEKWKSIRFEAKPKAKGGLAQ